MARKQETRHVRVADDAFAAEATSPLQDLGTLKTELFGLVHDQFKLAALELRLAALSLITMITCALFIAALAVLAWVGLLGAAGLALRGMGLAGSFVMLILTAMTVVLALLLGAFVRHQSRHLGFPATLRTLKTFPSGVAHKESMTRTPTSWAGQNP